MKTPLPFVWITFYLFILVLLPASTEAKISAVEKIATYPTQVEVEKQVRAYFADTPVMIEIARCESKFRQYTDSGSVLRGGASGGMIGVFQFFESIHMDGAKALGYDLATLEGNLGYAKHVYDSEGTTPWNSAKECWNVKSTQGPTTSTRAQLETKIKQLTEIISLLKKIQELRALR